jgi:hypothetical protein
MPINNRSYPTFALTHSTEVGIRRKGEGSYVDGEWVESPETLITIEANVQPVQFREIMMMPESERTKEWIKIYSVSEIRTAVEGPGGWEADFVDWDGYSYRVMKSKKYVMGILDHYCAYAAREPRTAIG